MKTTCGGDGGGGEAGDDGGDGNGDEDDGDGDGGALQRQHTGNRWM